MKRRILIVDDEPVVLKMLTVFLSVGGWSDYETANNGKEALDLIEIGKQFDLVISDVNMPEMDGIELAKRINGRLIPILFVSADDSNISKIKQAEIISYKGFLQKPYQLLDFLGKVREILGEPS